MNGSGPHRIAAPAKLNLFLRVVARREDGYHLLDSAVVFTSFCDILHFAPGSRDALCIEGPQASALAGGESNSCLAALRAWRGAGGEIGPLQITLDKRIPVAAGLGGGSADAAAALRYLQGHGTRPLDPSVLDRIALGLGADVPACLSSRPQRVAGVGEKLEPLDLPAGTPVLLAHPGTQLSTASVFAGLREAELRASMETGPLPSRLAFGAVHELVEHGNALEPPATRLEPKIAGLLERLSGFRGAAISAMSGSGAACFAVFDDDSDCSAAAQELTEAGTWAIATEF